MRKEVIAKRDALCKALACPAIEYGGKCCIVGCVRTVKDLFDKLDNIEYSLKPTNDPAKEKE